MNRNKMPITFVAIIPRTKFDKKPEEEVANKILAIDKK